MIKGMQRVKDKFVPKKEKGNITKKPGGKKKKVKIFILMGVAVCIGAVIFGVVRHSKNKDNSSQVLTDFVSRGSIAATVEGTGTTLPKNSATITLPAAGKVQQIYVSEGEHVTKGTPLFKIQSDTVKESVEKAQKDVDTNQKALEKLKEEAANLTLHAPYNGKLIDVQSLKAGQTVNSGDKVATIVDDSKMRLSQYYSYAYEKNIYVGQAATVSIPSTMAQVSGKVEAIHKVHRISNNGSVLFEVDILINNPGALTSDMAASATMTGSSGEIIYPYEAGKLAYYRSGDLTAKASGSIKQVNLMNYADVTAGQTLMELSSKDSDEAIAEQQTQLDTAAETLKQAKEDLAKFNATAPIDGTVMSIGISVGKDAEAGTVAINIADTSVMLVNAKVDERNIAYIKNGMQVDLDQWGVTAAGTVTSVSLTAAVENGVSSFPVVITVDNQSGTLTNGGSVTFSFTASESDDCLLLPIQCVKNVETPHGSDTVVFLKSDKKPKNAVDLTSSVEDIPSGFYPIPVKIGIADDANVEILSGVDEGDEVFTQVMDSDSTDDMMAG